MKTTLLTLAALLSLASAAQAGEKPRSKGTATVGSNSTLRSADAKSYGGDEQANGKARAANAAASPGAGRKKRDRSNLESESSVPIQGKQKGE